MRIRRRLICLACALFLLVSLNGCRLPSVSGLGAEQAETLGGMSSLGGYLNETTGEALVLDYSGIAYSGPLEGDTLAVTEVYAYTRAGRTLRLYQARPPHLAADFTAPTYEFMLGLFDATSPDEIGDFVGQYSEYDLVYSEALAQADADLPLSSRPALWAIAFAARDDPPVAATSAPQPIVEDVGQPAANSAITREDYYARSTLAEGDRALYDAAYDGIAQLQPQIDVAALGLSIDDTRHILDCIENDAPELFWWSGKSVLRHLDGLVQTIEPQYGYSPEEARGLQAQIDAVADEILAPVDGTMSEYQKAVHIAGELGRRITYDQAAAERIAAGPANAVADPADHDHQTIVGGLVDGLALCTGITRSYQYLLGRVGILAPCVTGTLLSPSSGLPLGAHAWNLMRIDGEWYYADLTNALEAAAAGEFDAFLQSDRDIRACYVLTILNDPGDLGDDVNENPPLPACTSDRFDGDVRRQLAFGDFGDGAADHLKSAVYTMMRDGTCAQEITFADAAARARAVALVERDGAAIARDIPACEGVAVCDLELAASEVETEAWLIPVYVIVPSSPAGP